jgi:DNA mismatch endonuclease (patch repair protein)
MEVSCASCGKVIARKPSQARERNYCSRICHYASGAPRPTRKLGAVKQCEACRADFYAPRARPDARFCSRSCKGLASRASFACEVCGTESYGFRNRNKRWCSRTCASAARKSGETLTCEQCGSGFYVPKGRAVLNETRFCSIACLNAWQGRNKTEHACKICGGAFRWSPSRSEGGQYNITYCSLACRDADPERRALLLELQGRMLRGRTTSIERIGYRLLDEIGVTYQAQVPFMGRFIPDAILPAERLIVQFDGDYWHDRKGTSTEPRILRRVASDRAQNAYIKACGWRVLRLWGTDLEGDPEGCIEQIRQHLRPPS